jgi:predicted AAA+ superfamily ATPase
MYPRFYKLLKDRSFFLFGPRGTGKSTWLREVLPEAQVVDLLDSRAHRMLAADPSRLPGMLAGDSGWVVIDEIQKVPALLDEVHRLIETKRWKFALTGSSARKIKRGGANLLAGRALQRNFFPLTIWELGGDWKLRRALDTGLLPESWTYSQPKDFLESYVSVYLREEVFAEGLARNLGAFARFLEIMAYSQGSTVSMATAARDVGVDPKLLANHLDLLEDLLLAVRVPVFTLRAKRRMTAHPKFYYFDSGIFRVLRPKGPLDSDAELDGPALETLFLQHHRALGEFVQWDQKLFFWKTAAKVEVDFVSYGSLGLFAFEVKRSAHVSSAELGPLLAFREDYPMAQAFVFYGGERRERREGIEFIPFEEGLRELPRIFGVNL